MIPILSFSLSIKFGRSIIPITNIVVIELTDDGHSLGIDFGSPNSFMSSIDISRGVNNDEFNAALLERGGLKS